MIKAQNFLMASGKPIFTPLVQVKTGQNPNKESWTKAFAAAEPEPEAPAPVLPTRALTHTLCMLARLPRIDCIYRPRIY